MIEKIAGFWLEWVLAVLAGALALGYRRLVLRMNKANAKSEALEKGMRALLRDNIIRNYNNYQGQGKWPIYARDSMLDMYAQYTALGGNGAVKTLMDDLRELPTERQEE